MAKTNEVIEVEKQEVAPSEGAERLSNRRSFMPRCDIYEMEDKVFVVADMPGIDSESVDIKVEKNILTIDGWVAPEEDDKHSLAYSEYEVGDYQRRFTLSNEIDITHIEAKVKDGVLRLYLPKVIPSSKKVIVRAG
jgi:HSP20 family protein